jgi:NitT/TauT family transport system permease protein
LTARLARQALSLLLLAAAWQGLVLMLPGNSVLPSPAHVAGTFTTALLHGDLLRQVAVTLARVAAAFVLALSLGTVIGVALGRCKVLDGLLDGWVTFFLNLPALVTTILCFMWFGLGEPATVAAVAVNKIPSVVVTVREGARALDPNYAAVARAYNFGPWRSLRHVVLPQLAPYLVVAARNGLALIWKIVLVVELLGRSDGIGFKLHVLFQLFDVPGILAYSLAFIAVVQAIELALLAPLERRIEVWRG